MADILTPPSSFVLVPQVIPAALRDIPDPNNDPTDKAFTELARSRMSLAHMRCIGCGFSDIGGRGVPAGVSAVHHINHDHSDNTDSNLFPVCPICHDILELGFAPRHERGEVLIGSVPSQPDLVNLSRTLMVAAASGGEFVDTARQVIKEIRDAMWTTTREVMPNDYDGRVQTFGQMLQSGIFSERVKDVPAALARVRYVPFLDAYPDATAHWSVTAFPTYPESEWPQFAMSATP